ncbi:hypothetical protein CMUS01_03551 [Colletotrichum musicola]|uniref:Uncharacterized protein n=1 Tax=Colletotrichum musicola TaxID=2175873 RepID=A0A8H6NS92_9PEZI|nr:hypothetical protein CMUS01_03551 [Colletotrichum musicola]
MSRSPPSGQPAVLSRWPQRLGCILPRVWGSTTPYRASLLRLTLIARQTQGRENCIMAAPFPGDGWEGPSANGSPKGTSRRVWRKQPVGQVVEHRRSEVGTGILSRTNGLARVTRPLHSSLA